MYIEFFFEVYLKNINIYEKKKKKQINYSILKQISKYK